LYELFLFQVLIQKTFNREYMCCRLDEIFFLISNLDMVMTKWSIYFSLWEVDEWRNMLE
jgi:hypothetical protein